MGSFLCRDLALRERKNNAVQGSVVISGGHMDKRWNTEMFAQTVLSRFCKSNSSQYLTNNYSNSQKNREKFHSKDLNVNREKGSTRFDSSPHSRDPIESDCGCSWEGWHCSHTRLRTVIRGLIIEYPSSVFSVKGAALLARIMSNIN